MWLEEVSQKRKMTSVYGSYDRMMMTIMMVIMATTTTTTTTAIMMMMMMMITTIRVAKVKVYLYLKLDFPCLHDIVFLTSFDKKLFNTKSPRRLQRKKGTLRYTVPAYGYGWVNMYATQLYKRWPDEVPDMTIAAPLYPVAYQFLWGKRPSTSTSETVYLKGL